MEEHSQFEGIGRALRLLRLRLGRKQYEVARTASITKAMLSAYETGKRQPSLATLGSLLDALEADLSDLHRALLADLRQERALAPAGRPPGHDAPSPPGGVESLELAEPDDLYRVLGSPRRLPPEQERALAEMLHGFHSLLRYFHRRLAH
jgi:transcriptional regulator with XRE-family HTH domain